MRRMHETGTTKVELARLLGVSEGAVRRLLRFDHRSHIERIEAALAKLGSRLDLRAASGGLNRDVKMRSRRVRTERADLARGLGRAGCGRAVPGVRSTPLRRPSWRYGPLATGGA
jgi:hypothetical protein